MSGRLNDILSLASTALNAQRLAMNTVSQNIANVGTAGYSRQRAVLETGPVIDAGAWKLGTGVRVSDVVRQRDDLVQQQLYQDSSTCGREQAREVPLYRLEALFPVGEEVGLPANLEAFFSAFNGLAADPGSSEARSEVLSASTELAGQVRAAATGIEQLRSDADVELEGVVGRINALSSQAAGLDAQIRRLEAGGGQAPDLRDSFDRTIAELAELTDVRVLRDPEGAATVVGAGGHMLVAQGQACRLELTAGAGEHPAVSWVGLDGTTIDVSAELDQGQLGGLLRTRDDDLVEIQEGLDRFAFRFAAAVNEVHRGGSGLDGAGGRDLFVPLAVETGAASSLTVDPGRNDLATLAAAADAAGLPADNGAAKAMVALRDLALGDAGRPVDALAHLTFRVGQQADENARLLEGAQGQYESTLALRDAVSGVSLDEEAIDLIKLQNAFAAAAKVIQVVDEMMTTVLGLKQ